MTRDVQAPAGEFVDAAHVADMLRLGRRAVILMAQRGDLPAVRIGRRWRFHLPTLRSRLAALAPRPAPGREPAGAKAPPTSKAEFRRRMGMA